MTISTSSLLDVFVDGSPTAKVEVAYAEVGPDGDLHGFR